jgi:hypothetical protein
VAVAGVEHREIGQRREGGMPGELQDEREPLLEPAVEEQRRLERAELRREVVGPGEGANRGHAIEGGANALELEAHGAGIHATVVERHRVAQGGDA